MDEVAKMLNQLSNPLLTVCAIGALRVLMDLRDQIQKLNTQVAVVISRVDSHETRITKLEA